MHRGDGAQPSCLVVAERLHDLLARVHDEGPHPCDRLADGQAAQDEYIHARAVARLHGRRPHGQAVAWSVDGQLAHADGPSCRTHLAIAVEDIEQTVVVGAPGQREFGSGAQRGVDLCHRRVRRTRSGGAGDLAGDDADQRTAIGRRDQRDLIGAQILIAGVGPLALPRQVHPELEAVEEAAADDQVLGRLLDVEDACAGRHPLRVAVGDASATAVRVGVLEDAVDHVGDGLEAAVRMPGRALGLTGGVLHLTHLVEMDEGVQVAQVHAGERASDGEPLALEGAGGARDALDRAWASRQRIGGGQAREDG